MRMDVLLPAIAFTTVPVIVYSGPILSLTVGFAPGGTSSIAAQIIAEAFPKIAGYTVIVENKPGAGGEIAARWVRGMKSRAFLFMSSTSTLQAPPGPDLVPVALVARFDYVIVSRPETAATLDAYVRASRDNRLLQNFATAGSKSIAHLIGAKLFRDADAQGVHIPFKSSREAVDAILKGVVGIAIVPEPDVVGRTDIAEIARTGRDIDIGGWLGVFASSATTLEEMRDVSRLLREASLASVKKFRALGLQSVWADGTALGALHRSDYERLLPVLNSLDLAQ
ncbi:MAG: hypothetical protein RLZZ416_793 [Candidatus Parcubacteria bacterium]|jgi:tripartite-type tricarboxylate transporter receptor subunit TctC